MVFIFCRLVLGAAAAFFAIVLWSGTRDIAWMFMAGGTAAAYGESLYAVLNSFGISIPAIESAPTAAMALSTIPVLFFIAAFLLMVIRSYGNSR
jgi:hypothetical protein